MTGRRPLARFSLAGLLHHSPRSNRASRVSYALTPTALRNADATAVDIANLHATAAEYGNAWEISSRSRFACRAIHGTRCNFCGEMASAGL
jgi:hypothetical protein